MDMQLILGREALERSEGFDGGHCARAVVEQLAAAWRPDVEIDLSHSRGPADRKLIQPCQLDITRSVDVQSGFDESASVALQCSAAKPKRPQDSLLYTPHLFRGALWRATWHRGKGTRSLPLDHHATFGVCEAEQI